MRFIILIYANIIIAILMIILVEIFYYLKTKNFKISQPLIFIGLILSISIIFYFLSKYFENILLIKLFIVIHTFLLVTVVCLYVYVFKKSIIQFNNLNIILILSILLFSQVSNLSNTLTLTNYSSKPVIIDQTNIYKNADNTLYFGPYISLPNGFFQIMIKYKSQYDLDYQITIFSAKISINNGILKSNYSFETNKVIIENNLADNLEIIIPDHKKQAKIEFYKIYPILITEYSILSSIQLIFSSILIFLLVSHILLIFYIFVDRYRLTKSIISWSIPIFLFLASLVSLISILFTVDKTLLLVFLIIVFFVIIKVIVLVFLRESSNIPKLLIFIVIVFSAVVLTTINYGFPQTNIYPDEEDLVKGYYSFLKEPNIFHDNVYPYLFPHHYSAIHLGYLFVYPISIIANSLFPEYGIGYFSKNPEVLLIASRMITILFAFLSIITIFFISRIIFKNQSIAILSAIVLSLSPIFFHMSHIAKTNTLIIFGILLSIYFAIKYSEERKNLYLILSSVSATIPASLKINFITLLVIPIIIYTYILIKEKNFDLKFHTKVFFKVLFYTTISFLILLPNILVIPNYIIERFIFETGEKIELSKRLTLALEEYIWNGLVIGSGISPFLLFLIGLLTMFRSVSLNTNSKLYLYSILVFGLINIIPLCLLSSRPLPRFSDFFIPIISIFSSYVLYQIIKKYRALFVILIFLLLFLIVLEKYYFLKPITTIEARNWILSNIPTNQNIYSVNLKSYYHRIVLKNIKDNLPQKLSTGEYIIFYKYSNDETINIQNLELITNFNKYYHETNYVYFTELEHMIRFYTNFHKIRAINPSIEIYRVK